MMNEVQLEADLVELVEKANSDPAWLADFPFRLMQAYQASRNEIAKLRMKYHGQDPFKKVIWPRKLLYRPARVGMVAEVVSELRSIPFKSNAPRFVMSTDGDELAIYDTKLGESFSGSRIADLVTAYDFLQPMFGVERYVPPVEQALDVDAARKMRRFYDALVAANRSWCDSSGRLLPARVHTMNLFMTRTLFCLFADSARIFSDHRIAALLAKTTVHRGANDIHDFMSDLFAVLNMELADPKRENIRPSLRKLKYVNGGLFKDDADIPSFSTAARSSLLDAAGLRWKDINPDIFGSMIQAIARIEDRAELGMHYTSVPNIMKVLGPLFLDDLHKQLNAAGNDRSKISSLLGRLSRIRVLDPACGSGNFLIVAYRELRRIETAALIRQHGVQIALDLRSGIELSSFYGIDPVDFACETARLSLWISQYQMDKELEAVGLAPPPSLPLSQSGVVIVDNALHRPWTDVCPPVEDGETYIIGNPPYLGMAEQTAEQKRDMQICFSASPLPIRKLDYVTCWFVRAAEYVRTVPKSAFAFVATNSIVQGEHVSKLWPQVLQDDLEILYGHTSFKWSNSAKDNAGVTCVIVGVGRRRPGDKLLFSLDSSVTCSAISPYLVPGRSVIVEAVPNNIGRDPRMVFGNMARDDGNLILSGEEKDELVSAHPRAQPLIRRFVGSQEYIRGGERWCLWIPDSQIDLANSIEPIRKRLEATREFRLASRAESTIAAAATPHRFVQIQGTGDRSLIIPRHSSERRHYLPVGLLYDGTIVADSAFAIYEPPTWIFALLSCRLHTLWTKAVGGRLKTDMRYSNTLVYNTFPTPSFSKDQKASLERQALNIIAARERHLTQGRTIAWLYNPETMPDDLTAAHGELDVLIESLYSDTPFRDDRERLEALFKRYSRSNQTYRNRRAA